MTPHRCCPSRRVGLDVSSGRRNRTFVAWFKARRPTADRSPIRFQSALRESNPPVQLGRLMPCANRPRAQKAEGEGVEPRAPPRSGGRLIARPLSPTAAIARAPCTHGRLDLPYQSASCGGRNRTCVRAVNSRLPVPTQVPPQSKSGRPDLNRRSRAPESRGIPGFPTSCSARAPSGS